MFLSNPELGSVQGIVNSQNTRELLRTKFTNTEFNYAREFKVFLKRVTTFRKNRVWVTDEAAHVQSPVGVQELNLAVVDAVILSNWIYQDEVYAEKKMTGFTKKTLLFTDFDKRMLATNACSIRMIRNKYWMIVQYFPSISCWFFKSISGINHYKPNYPQRRTSVHFMPQT